MVHVPAVLLKRSAVIHWLSAARPPSRRPRRGGAAEPAGLRRRYVTETVLLKSVTVPRTSLTDDLGLKHCRELLVTFGSPYVTSHKHNAAAAAAAAPLTTAKSQRKHKNFILIKFSSSRRVQIAAICIYIVCSRRCVEDTLTFTVLCCRVTANWR